ncbi:MAG: DUF4136 domain-containing protein [Gammaproteobacteria bacterium]|nr:DUF4136 domain-containing protein [Gammaproteobacteria bacterium]
MKTIQFITIAGIVGIITACAQISTKTELGKEADFSQLKTYSWGASNVELEKTGKTVDRIMKDAGVTVTDNIQPAVNKELAAKGYTLITEGKPDFIVQYSLKSEIAEQFRRETYAPGAVAPSSTEQAGAMVLGKMTIYILDSESFNLLWRGEAETIVKADEKTRSRITSTIEKLFSDFPSRPQ